MGRVCRVLAIVAGIAAGSAHARAQSDATSPNTLISVTPRTFTSKVLKASRTFLVALPTEYASSAARFPVLTIMDAGDVPQFTAAVANIRFLASRNRIPPLIIVGILNGKDRTYELTPPANATQASAFKTAGGASANLRFVIEEVFPIVDSTYRTLKTRVLAGHSFGGLFVLNAMITKPDAFRVFIAMSPSLWWNDSTVVDQWSSALSRDVGRERTLFVTSGGLEPSIDGPTQRFVELLSRSKPASLSFGYQRYPENPHNMTPLPSLVDGLRMAFAPLVVSVDSALRTFASMTVPDTAAMRYVLTTLEKRYATAAESFGLPADFPESALNAFGLSAARMNAGHFAIDVLRMNAARYPRSASTYAYIGEALLISADTAGARAAFRKSVNLAAPTKDPVGATSQQRLNALAARR